MNFKINLDWLKPAPSLPEMTDSALVQKEYKYWRMRIFYSIYVGYVFFYFTRKSFTFITPFMMQEFGLTIQDIGFLGTILSVAYGLGKFASGMLCDKSNPRYFMAIGLILTGVCNLLFGFSSSLLLFALFWGLNGWFQGWGWPACTKQLTHWFSRSERGTWWSICTTSHYLGGFVIVYIAGYCAKWFGWRYGMFVPGILCIFVGLWLLNRLRDTPRSLGLPIIEKFKNEAEFKEKTLESTSTKDILFGEILKNKYIWVLVASYFFAYFVRTATNDFTNLYLVQVKGFAPLMAGATVSWFEIGGFLGVLFAGWGSDYFFEGKRIPITILTSFVLIFSVVGLRYIPQHSMMSFIFASILVAFIGFLVSAPIMLIGLASAEFVSKKAASTSNGFAGFFGYLGAAIAGLPLSMMIKEWGWNSFILTLVACSACTTIILIPMWSSRGEKMEKDKPEETVEFIPDLSSRAV